MKYLVSAGAMFSSLVLSVLYFLLLIYFVGDSLTAVLVFLPLFVLSLGVYFSLGKKVDKKSETNTQLFIKWTFLFLSLISGCALVLMFLLRDSFKGF